MRSDLVEHDRRGTHPINQQQIGSNPALNEASPIGSSLSQAMFSERLRQGLTCNKQIEDIAERFQIEIRMKPGFLIVSLEPGENYQLPSHLMASRPVLNRRPLPCDSSLPEFWSAVRISAAERDSSALPTQARSAAVGVRLPVRAFRALTSCGVSSMVIVVTSCLGFFVLTIPAVLIPSISEKCAFFQKCATNRPLNSS